MFDPRDREREYSRCITHVASLSVITRVVKIRDPMNQAFVTGSSPFCDSSCKFVHGPIVQPSPVLVS